MELTNKTCQPFNHGDAPLSAAEVSALLTQLSDWQLDPDKNEICHEYRFKNYYQTMAFVNAIAWISHQEDHHPDLEVGYNRCLVRYRTHAVDGLTENDFICAARADALFTSSAVPRHNPLPKV